MIFYQIILFCVLPFLWETCNLIDEHIYTLLLKNINKLLKTLTFIKVTEKMHTLKVIYSCISRVTLGRERSQLSTSSYPLQILEAFSYFLALTHFVLTSIYTKSLGRLFVDSMSCEGRIFSAFLPHEASLQVQLSLFDYN